MQVMIKVEQMAFVILPSILMHQHEQECAGVSAKIDRRMTKTEQTPHNNIYSCSGKRRRTTGPHAGERCP